MLLSFLFSPVHFGLYNVFPFNGHLIPHSEGYFSLFFRTKSLHGLINNLLLWAFFFHKRFSEFWGEMPVGGWLVSCVAFFNSSFLHCTGTKDLSRPLPWILCRWLWSGKKCFAYNKWKLLSKNSFWKNKTRKNRTKQVQEVERNALQWKCCSLYLASGIVALKNLLDIRQCRSWILQRCHRTLLMEHPHTC